MKHTTPALLSGAVAAAVAYADDASPLGCAVAGLVVAVGVWALAYALDHRR